MTFMPCSGFTGANLKDRVNKNVCNWCSGPSFLEFLEKLPDFEWPFDKPVKILVSERYKDMGTIVIGKVESGTVRIGDKFTLMPNKQPVKVMGILGSDEQEANTCRAGENVKLKLSGVEEDEVLPGFVICHNETLCNTGQVFDAQVVILEHKSIICAGYKCVLHIHNAVEEVTLVVSFYFCATSISGCDIFILVLSQNYSPNLINLKVVSTTFLRVCFLCLT